MTHCSFRVHGCVFLEFFYSKITWSGILLSFLLAICWHTMKKERETKHIAPFVFMDVVFLELFSLNVATNNSTFVLLFCIKQTNTFWHSKCEEKEIVLYDLISLQHVSGSRQETLNCTIVTTSRENDEHIFFLFVLTSNHFNLSTHRHTMTILISLISFARWDDCICSHIHFPL